jgi:hypothetical protein
MVVRDQHSNLLDPISFAKNKVLRIRTQRSDYYITSGACTIKLFTVVIYGFSS